MMHIWCVAKWASEEKVNIWNYPILGDGFSKPYPLPLIGSYLSKYEKTISNFLSLHGDFRKVNF
jgi:hypothetical protein